MAPFGHKFDKRWRFLGPGGVLDVNNLTEAHLRAVYGLEHCPSKENDQNSPGGVWGESARPENQNRLYPYCNNRYAPQETSPILTGSSHASNKACTLAKCKEGNPHCLNYFGQAQWESEDAFETYYGARFKEASEELVKRPREIPAGMKNLGATCYANSLLQVWFHDMVFRKCIYQCQFASEAGKNMNVLQQLQQVFLYLDLGSRTVYNPLALVKSLNLDTSMQQDAQEFCNLFLAKIDSQLQLQEDPFLRDFVKNQFQGRYSYHTTCGHCKKLSTRECTFYELMLNIRDNNTLMDSLEDFIEPEELKGADQYFCSACASLQDASRAIKFEALPEVLNIQLMRFVYDSSTWTKKKSKDVLRFPETIDLGELLEPKQSVLYDLSAVLVHSGPSAYSGHFVAYVMDPKSKKWFMLNDEDVREFSSANFDPEELIESMGKSDSKKDSSKMASSDSEKLLNMLSSKNAYMLIYSKRKIDAIPQPTPSPGESLRSVLEDNESLEKDLQKIAKEKEEVRSSFNAARDERRHLYRQWEVTDDQQGGCYIARETLEEYMQFPKDPAETGPEDKASQETIIIDNSSITCKHQKLCPLGFSKSKLVNENAMNVFLNSGRFKMETTLTRTDFCEVCTKNVCRDKLYSFFHRKDIEEFERKAKSVRSPGHAWVSRSWLSEWLKVTPLFRLEHGSVQDDPKPTSREFLSDILCPHEMLNADKTRRRLINKSAFSVLEKAFGELSLPGGDSVECTVCLDEKKPKVDNRKDVASRAASEKTELADMLMRGPRIWQMEDGVRYCIVSQVFMKKWTSFVKRPLANDRPDALDNATLLCPHDLFLFDMNNKVDFENQDDICIIKEEEWGHLLALYGGGPVITVLKRAAVNSTSASPSSSSSSSCEEEAVPSTIESVPAACQSCRKTRILDYASTKLLIRVYSPGEAEAEGGNDSVETPTEGMATGRGRGRGRGKGVGVGVGGNRRSKRPRTTKKRFKEISVLASKWDTVMDLKLKIMEKTDIVPLYQRLMFGSVELEKNEATMADLEIPPKSELDLFVFDQGEGAFECLGEMQDVMPVPRDEGGFGGTGLAGDWLDYE